VRRRVWREDQGLSLRARPPVFTFRSSPAASDPYKGGDIVKRIRARVAGPDVHRDTVVASGQVQLPDRSVDVTKESFSTTAKGLVSWRRGGVMRVSRRWRRGHRVLVGGAEALRECLPVRTLKLLESPRQPSSRTADANAPRTTPGDAATPPSDPCPLSTSDRPGQLTDDLLRCMPLQFHREVLLPRILDFGLSQHADHYPGVPSTEPGSEIVHG